MVTPNSPARHETPRDELLAASVCEQLLAVTYPRDP